MVRKSIEVATAVGLVLFLLLGSGLGCSRSDQPQPQSQQSSAPAVQQVQPPAPTPAPPQATSMPASPPSGASPQYAAPSQPPAMQPPAGPHNFNQVQLGMTSADIRQLMGDPGKVKQKGQKIEWEYWTAQGKFEVEMVNDRVVSIEKD